MATVQLHEPGADALLTSCGRGDGSPLPFYLRYGFVEAGEKWGEALLRLDLTARNGTPTGGRS